MRGLFLVFAVLALIPLASALSSGSDNTTFAYTYNLNFERGNNDYWVRSGVGQSPVPSVTGEWKNEGDYSMSISGLQANLGFSSSFVHNETTIEVGDEVCFNLHKNDSYYSRWSLKSASGQEVLSYIIDQDYIDLCQTANRNGSLGFTVAGADTYGCLVGSHCYNRFSFDNITINAHKCDNGVLDHFEQDVDCGGFCGACVEKPQESLLEKYAPVLYFHPDEQFFPTSIDAMLNESDLYEDDLIFDDLIDERPVDVNSLNASTTTDEFYLDLRNASGGLAMFEVPNSNRFDKFEPTVYTNEIILNTGNIVLQYWFFYVFNDWENKHEGDWEMIQILFDNETNPMNVTYSYHWGGTTISWNETELVDQTHPKVFVTLGGHGSWPSSGIHDWTQFEFGCTAKHDVTSAEGPMLNYNDFQLTNLNETNWINFPGNWGEVGTVGATGPISPPLIDYGAGNRWNNPIEWSNDPQPNLYTFCTGSPVDIHVFDEEGNHAGLTNGSIDSKINGTYLYLPSNNSKELMAIASQKPLRLVINATDHGAFNLSIRKYDRDLAREINLYYHNIEVINSTSAAINFNTKNPNFILHIDLNGDNLMDKSVNPTIVSGNENSNETDSDNDGYADSIDTCPTLYNPNQETDFDGDGYDNLLCGGNDCNDDNSTINPGAVEFCNEIDDNCDSLVDDLTCEEDDNDGNDDNDDDDSTNLCAEYIPDNIDNVKPNHYTGEWLGCSCTQILECKPGKNKGELKHGCTKGTINVWLSQKGWAANC